MTSPRQDAREAGHIHYKGSACKIHGDILRYVSNGMCIDCQREAKAEHRVESGEQAYPAAYHSGRNSRSKGRDKRPPAIMSDENRSWWLAGWNDRDIEKSVDESCEVRNPNSMHETNRGNEA